LAVVMGGLSEPLLSTSAPATKLQGAVFVLANTILGAGMLSLPSAFAACGWLVAPAMLFAFGGASTTALILLSECGDAVGRPATFNAVAERAIPGSAVLFDAAIAIKCFGVATSYLVVVGDSVPKAMVAFGLEGLWLQRRLWVLVSLGLAAPLAYMPRITALRHTSLAALSCVLIITVMVVLFCFHPMYPFIDPCPGDDDYASGCRGPTQLVTTPGQTLRALPLFVFSFTCHQNMISITNELLRPSRGRCWAVALCSIGTAIIVYLCMSFSGYATFGSKVQSNILSNYPSESAVVAAARVMISLVVTCCYPLQAHPSRSCVTTILNTTSLGKALSPTFMHILLTTLFVMASGTIAFFVSDLGLVLSVVGATGSTIVTYVLPGACYFRLFPSRPSRWVGLALLLAGALFICPVSLYLIFTK